MGMPVEQKTQINIKSPLSALPAALRSFNLVVSLIYYFSLIYYYGGERYDNSIYNG